MKSQYLPLLLALSSASSFAQGPLDPPSFNPSATMRTLDQVEPRTPIPQSPAIPLAGPHFIISQPGSYYLTGNINVSTGDAILITATSDVSIDLNGFTIATILTGSVSGSGIALPPSFARLTVRNGSIRSGTIVPLNGAAPALAGFVSGINGLTGFPETWLSESHISDVRVQGCAENGIAAGKHSVIENCNTNHNGYDGILAMNSSMTGCIANRNGRIGISNLHGNVANSVASQNVRSGILVGYGIVTYCYSWENVTGGGNSSNIEFTNGLKIGCQP